MVLRQFQKVLLEDVLAANFWVDFSLVWVEVVKLLRNIKVGLLDMTGEEEIGELYC